MNGINKFIDHTLLKPTATPADIVRLCNEAREYVFYSVCVNSVHVSLAKEKTTGSSVKTCSVIGFPLGAMTTESKIFEARQAVADGADEIDMVLDIGALKSGNLQKVSDEISAVKSAIENRILKVILETCYLSVQEIKRGCEMAVLAKADFVKTSTGFGTRGAKMEDIELMKAVVQNRIKIKASGGINNLEIARSMIRAGAERIGTSSGVTIMTTQKDDHV